MTAIVIIDWNTGMMRLLMVSASGTLLAGIWLSVSNMAATASW